MMAKEAAIANTGRMPLFEGVGVECCETWLAGAFLFTQTMLKPAIKTMATAKIMNTIMY